MLKLIKATTNDVVLTLKEKEIYPFQTYIFIFRSLDSTTNYVTSLLKAADSSPYPYRYNRFDIVETTNPDLTIGEIELGVEGIYYYSVYSINATLTQNQVKAIALMTQAQIEAYSNYELESGQCYVEGFVNSTPSYTPDVINTTTYQPS